MCLFGVIFMCFMIKSLWFLIALAKDIKCNLTTIDPHKKKRSQLFYMLLDTIQLYSDGKLLSELLLFNWLDCVLKLRFCF